MKHTIIIAMILMFVSKSITTQAQTKEEITSVEHSIQANGKYALLVKNAKHYKAAILTGKELKVNHPKIDFQIVICGELVKELANDTALQQSTNEATSKGLKIIACGLSIKQLSVDKTLLPKSVAITQNGLIYLFGLEEKGYKTITL